MFIWISQSLTHEPYRCERIRISEASLYHLQMYILASNIGKQIRETVLAEGVNFFRGLKAVGRKYSRRNLKALVFQHFSAHGFFKWLARRNLFGAYENFIYKKLVRISRCCLSTPLK